MSIVLGRRGFVLKRGNPFPNFFIQKEIKDKLLVIPKNDGYGIVKSFKLYQEDKQGNLILPRYFGVSKISEPDAEEFTYNEEINFNFSGKLRKNQIEPAREVLKALGETGGGILACRTGHGKTFLALYCVYKMKCKTIVIVNRIELIAQWIEECKRFMPGVRVGKIQGETFDIREKDIVIAMLNTVSMKKFKPEAFNCFDLLIVDECHSVAGEIFHLCLPKIRTPWTLGLSATPERKDGTMFVVEWFLGPICYRSVNKINSEKPVLLDIVKIESKDEKYEAELTLEWNGKCDMAKMLNNMVKNPERCKIIIDKLRELLLDPKRKILVLSDRKALLKKIYKELGDVSAMYVGGMKREELTKSKESRVLLGTYSICGTGFNLIDLNCLVMATPRKSIEQSIGRILRKEHDINPLIVDIVDNFSIFKFMAKSRMRFYKECKILRNSLEFQCIPRPPREFQ